MSTQLAIYGLDPVWWTQVYEAAAATGWVRWCRPSPPRGARTSSPTRSSPIPGGCARPTPASGRRSWPMLAAKFAVRVHPQSVERALVRAESPKSGTSTVRAATDPTWWTATSGCGARALGRESDGWRLGVVQQRGVAAWLQVRQAADTQQKPSGAPGLAPRGSLLLRLVSLAKLSSSRNTSPADQLISFVGHRSSAGEPQCGGHSSFRLPHL